MRVAHVPGDHPYVDAVDPDAVRLTDPWTAATAARRRVDVLHVHFGFEQLSVEQLGTWIDDVHAAGIRIVHTVHDIDNPHLVDQRDHHRRTRCLVEWADAVTTLTSSAADEIERRWGRRPAVIAHPEIAGRADIIRTRSHSRGQHHALMWLGTLRANIDRAAAAEFVRDPSCDVVVVVRSDAWSRCDPVLRRILDRSDRDRRIVLKVISRPSDRSLADLVAAAGVLVLPYAWGTHSGLVELATDLGVPTVVPSGGSHHDQGAVSCSRFDLMTTAAQAVECPPSVVREAHRRTASIRMTHSDLYESVVASPLLRSRSAAR